MSGKSWKSKEERAASVTNMLAFRAAVRAFPLAEDATDSPRAECCHRSQAESARSEDLREQEQRRGGLKRCTLKTNARHVVLI